MKATTDQADNHRTFHPLAALAAAAALFIPAAAWSNPLWLGSLCAAALAALAAVSGRESCRRALAVSLPAAVVFAFVNVLVSRSGETVLFVFPELPLMGAPRLFLEPVVFGLAAGMRIALAVAAFSLADALADADETFALCSRFAPKTALATALAILAIPRMKRDLDRIRCVMSVRGAALDARGFFARIGASRPLLHALLLSSLEGAWDTAVALHTRGFGCGARSAMPMRPWEWRDRFLAAGGILSLAATVAGLFAGRGVYACYPRLAPLATRGDAPWLCASVGAFLAGVTLARRAPR